MYMYVTCCVAGHTHLLFIGYAKLTSAKQIVSNNISDTLWLSVSNGGYISEGNVGL